MLKDDESVTDGLLAEERAERDADKKYWRPLKAELEQLRRDLLKD